MRWPKHLPRRAGNRILFTDRQRHQYAAMLLAVESRIHAIANRHPQTIDAIVDAFDEIVALFVRALGAHVAGCADIAFQCECLEIVAVWIRIAVRPPQAHHELPALARPNNRRRGISSTFAAALYIPIERHMRRNPRTFSRGLFNIKFKTRAALAQGRQARHHPGHLHIAALPRLRKRGCQTRLSAHVRIAETKRRTANQHQRHEKHRNDCVRRHSKSRPHTSKTPQSERAHRKTQPHHAVRHIGRQR
jgi:hypothetical protein